MMFCSKKLIVLISLIVCMSFAFAGQKPVNRGESPGSRAPQKEAARELDSIFRDADRTLIRRYYANSYKNLPPGLAKREGDLPPGLQKQLQRNGQLPPGLEKRLQPFPAELELKLPTLRPGLSRGVIGRTAVIIDESAALVLDVLSLE